MDRVLQAENVVLVMLPADRTPLEQDVDEHLRQVALMLQLTPEEAEIVRKRVHAKVAIRMDVGTALVEEDLPPWLHARKSDIDPYFWTRYEQLLRNRSWPPAVLRTLDTVTDELLNLLGDPVRPGKWIRRGLVMGDVQSGKTSTYTALCCKAADSGYRLIVLLTGTLENLRRQTQERMDEGFVGLDSSDILAHDRKIRPGRAVGVGVLDKRRAAGVFTSRASDFNRRIVQALGFRLDAMNEPVLVVLKKHAKILDNLTDWLRDINAGPDGLIDMPILVIDDEADNASVNTRATEDPTAINEKIRTLLMLFTRSSYIGFTATPFANIYIDPETDDDMLGHDLFPRHFVYSLDSPSNYMGPGVVFSAEATSRPMLRFIDDAAAIFPDRHTAGLLVNRLPESLRIAIRSFLLAATIRDLRRESVPHRSMLVNISRFTKVQNQVRDLIEVEVMRLQQDIRHYSHLHPAEALKHESLATLHDTWRREYATTFPDWPEVQRALLKGALPVVVRAVNKSAPAATLDYRAYKDDGLRVIAVGGNSLSRGLTLEGLSTSYFFRNSQMYDTLLQMGRWFGYRDGYADLCRLWLTEEAAHWYAHITMASEELRQDLDRMRRSQRTPTDFGLKVRAHPDSLIVTARNKMRHARTIERVISVSGQGLETPRLRLRGDIVRSNARATEQFLRAIADDGVTCCVSPWNNLWWPDVPKSRIISFLRQFHGHTLNFAFQPEALADYLARTTEAKLQVWDVVIPNGSESDTVDLGGIAVRPVRRSVDLNRALDYVLISGSSARVGSRGIEREGLDPAVAKVIQEEYEEREGKSVPDSEYRRVRPRALLLVYVVRPYLEGNLLDLGTHPLIGLGLSFPRFDDHDSNRRVRYTVNPVEWRQLFDAETDDDQPDEVL